ncbi:MAG: type I methionyl aminopeptidase [Omnitrophica WOR_2 bacterium GWA2_47_8]|nr:MAG: type I methionyl aminopeptidase [Omnitrophica WOR_2 bacterium GWA2_47_8]
MIRIKSKDEIGVLRQAGRILSLISEEIKRSLKSGITTKDIDSLAESLMKKHKVAPAFKGYRGFPCSVCTSVNQEVVHGIPKNRSLKDGDIISVDLGIIFNDFYSDTAFTIGVGTITPELKRLLDVTEKSLYVGIDKARPENHLSDISHAIQTFVEAHHLSVVREFVGHGIGRNLHEEPEVPNFGPAHCGPILEEGMVLAIEPMVNLGTYKTRILEDGWTVVTEDGKPSAHFEHSVAIMANGPLILTQK